MRLPTSATTGVGASNDKPFAKIENAIENLFICDPKLLSCLKMHASDNQKLMAQIRSLDPNNLQIQMSHENQADFEHHTHHLLAQTPTTLKCVLSDEQQKGKPSLFIKEGANRRSVEIVYTSTQKEEIPHDDLEFAIHYINEWQQNQHVWPSIYAYYPAPKNVPAELTGGINEMPMSDLRTREDVCDLSDVGFKPFHGEKAPKQVTGRVITIKVPQGDNKPVANAIETQTQPGDIVLVDGGGPSASVTLGGITASLAEKVRGIKGILIYGQVRDQVELRSLAIPVFGLGCSASGPTKVGPGAVHCSLNLGTIPFKSGDIIKIDENQIVVVPSSNAAAILNLSEENDNDQRIEPTPSFQMQSTSERARKTFDPLEKGPSKKRPRPETPAFIPELFKGYSPAQICDTASFINPQRLWGSGPDMQLRIGSIPDGTTLVGTAVISSNHKEHILANLDHAKEGDFLVISGADETELDSAVMSKMAEKGISCVVIDGKVIIDDAVSKQYNIPCFARQPDLTNRPIQAPPATDISTLDRIELNDGFLIKSGYVMMADIDGIAAFSPTKFPMLYRAGYKKNMQEKTAEDRNNAGHPHPLPAGSIVTDRYYEPFVHAHIDQYPFLRTSRGWAKMQLPAEPTDLFVGRDGKRMKLDLGSKVQGIPTNVSTHEEEPITFTLKSEDGASSEIEGVSGRDLFTVALAVEHNAPIEVQGNGRIIKL